MEVGGGGVAEVLNKYFASVFNQGGRCDPGHGDRGTNSVTG